MSIIDMRESPASRNNINMVHLRPILQNNTIAVVALFRTSFYTSLQNLITILIEGMKSCLIIHTVINLHAFVLQSYVMKACILINHQLHNHLTV